MTKSIEWEMDHKKDIRLSEFEGFYDQGSCLTFVLQPQIIGRVSRIRMIEEIIVHIKSKPGELTGAAHQICMAALPRLLDKKKGLDWPENLK